MAGTGSDVEEQELDFPVDDVSLRGDLRVPRLARGLVVFAHGSGSSRHSPRNREVAAGLHRASMGTLLFDLLTEQEASDRTAVFDVPMLARRLTAVVEQAAHHGRLVDLPIGLFGASTGAAAALDAAAQLPGRIGAIVSRGGRPDLSGRLAQVDAPVLLIVGGDDGTVLELNRGAASQLRSSELVVVEGAGHLFEGPGQLEEVTGHAADWFRRYLGGTVPW